MKLLICAPDIFSGDAVGNHCLGLARVAQRLGLDAELYAQRHDVGTLDIHSIEDVFTDANNEDVVVLSYSIFDPFLEKLLELDQKKVCYFHGVTDPQLLREFEPRTATFCEMALEQLPLLTRFDVVIANSQNTAESLSDVLNVATVKIIPPVFADMPVFRYKPSSAEVTPRVPNLLMVGRVVPHKRIEDAIQILALLQQREFRATLTIVGNAPNYDYLKFLINHARSLGVLELVDFKGMLDDAGLFECYSTTSGLLAMSRHEGFCVPVLETMHFGKPVFVRGGTAAQELCAPSSVFEVDASLDTWAAAIAARLSKIADTQSGSARVEMNRAHEILRRTDAQVWESVFGTTSGTGEL